MAVNRCKMPSGMDESAGVTVTEVNIAAVTVSVAVPETLPEVAVIVDFPTASHCTRPLSLIVATEVTDDAHSTDVVTSFLLPSL